MLRRYVARMTGLSRVQVTHLIGRYPQGEVQLVRYRRHRFPQRYTRADIELLAAVDAAHQALSRPATRRILERECRQYGSRSTNGWPRSRCLTCTTCTNNRRYRECRLTYTKSKLAVVSIGGPIRQADPAICASTPCIRAINRQTKGVYHVNAVDDVTQWQIVAATPRIREAWLKPVLEAMLRQFPFRIFGFHSDNGSEFINQTVAKPNVNSLSNYGLRAQENETRGRNGGC